MKHLPNWRLPQGPPIVAGESSGSGRLALENYDDNLVRGEVVPWPPPEIVQKLVRSKHENDFIGIDNETVTRRLNYYSDLQSVASEDALTWSIIGPIVYASHDVRQAWNERFLALVGVENSLQAASDTSLWMWRTIPHPAQLQARSRPELDFGLLTRDVVLFGEGKWNSRVGRRQGPDQTHDQITLRRSYLTNHAPLLWGAKEYVLLIIVRDGNPVPEARPGVTALANAVYREVVLSWEQVVAIPEHPAAAELTAYLNWKLVHGA
jgi:hypothetical protein